MADEALEQALALLDAPIRRFEVRAKPLPDDIGVVIQLASASQPALGECARRLREPEDRLLEAVRFYLQQALLEPGTDAYRVLGVAPDASPGQIREHYRWLQRWLHPDRQGQAWEAQFSTRLNWAWRMLRNDSARKAYDSERAPGIVPPVQDNPVAPLAQGEWTAVPVGRRPSGAWLGRTLVGLSFAICLGLFYLALKVPDAPLIEDARIDAAVPVAVMTTRQADVQPMPTIGNPAMPGTPLDERAAEPESLVADSVSASVTPVDPPQFAIEMPAPEASRGSHATAVAALAGFPHADADVADQVVAQTAAPKPAARDAGAIRAVTQATARREAPRAAPAPGASPETASVAPGTAPHNDVVAAQEAASPVVTSTDAGSVPVAGQVLPAPSPPTTVAFQAPVRAAASLPAGELMDRIALARKQVGDIVEYFRSSDAVAPAWGDAPAPHSAWQQRGALRDRVGLESAAHFALDSPVWRVSDEEASIDAAYHAERAHRVAENGRFRMSMAWRGRAWQLVQVELEPQQ